MNHYIILDYTVIIDLPEE